MIAFGSSLTTIETTWADLKTKIASISTPYHYGDNGEIYEVFIIDVNVVYTTQIHKGAIPLSSTLTQEQNDAILTEFEEDYKDSANIPFSSVGIVTSSTAPRNDFEMIKDGLCHAHINSLTHLNTPAILDFKLSEDYPLQYLWGCSSHVKDFGEDDYIEMQIIDKDNVLGYGENTVLKEYDQVWCQTIAKSTAPFFTPDGAPGEIPGGVYARVLYYPSDALKTDIKLWIDYIITVKS